MSDSPSELPARSERRARRSREVNLTPVVQAGFLLALALSVALILYGLVLYPATLTASPAGLVSFIGLTTALMLYALLGVFGTGSLDHADKRILPYAAIAGVLAGIVLLSENLAEYLLLLPDPRIPLGIGFGAVAFLYFLSGFWGGALTASPRLGCFASAISGLIGSLIWLDAVLLASYVYSSTPQQYRMLLTTGSLESFQSSGLTDLSASVMQDLFGLGFFLLLTGPIAAGALGLAGALIGSGAVKLTTKMPRRSRLRNKQ